ncbi:primosomal protein N' (replication factor Y) - superfamily II helicase [Pseudorhodobacter sp.]|uniref:primosomal protein N' (replication factor Y) - superfamily II helicase n=1 Tax=Pseudorhodobacter sp. TaxID=1934400 RepID=UPI0026498AFA|nr:primosomal protein N' (replication factor Y) - superfamily II helicase [Pseudorhodobacter sp.]MDN5787199.1 primosomal protein N' (replication factor Y) - superfamily II helicase [Pseudorhodobacter sp.]
MSATKDLRWPCDTCGAELRFAPGQTELRCDHCGNVQKIPAAPESARQYAMGEHPLALGLRDDLPQTAMEEAQTTTCPNCGALVEFAGAGHATQCPFCATPLVIDTSTNRQIKPQALIPFQLDERTARSAMSKWLGSLWFAPNGLVEYARKGRALSGLYVPYWTFDAATRSQYTGQRGEYYYETRTVTVMVDGRSEQREEQVQKIQWYPASGILGRVFDDVLVLASRSLPRDYTEGLEPWDLSALQPYSADYLAGFTAEGYTVSLADGNARGHELMAKAIANDVRRDIGGDVQQINSINTAHSAETFKHILLPIWMAAYKYNSKTYRFVVNGQTGKVQGERPYSVWKITFAVVAIGLLIAAIAYFGNAQ